MSPPLVCVCVWWRDHGLRFKFPGIYTNSISLSFSLSLLVMPCLYYLPLSLVYAVPCLQVPNRRRSLGGWCWTGSNGRSPAQRERVRGVVFFSGAYIRKSVGRTHHNKKIKKNWQRLPDHAFHRCMPTLIECLIVYLSSCLYLTVHLCNCLFTYELIKNMSFSAMIAVSDPS